MTENKITINDLIEKLQKYIDEQNTTNISSKLKDILAQNNNIEPKEYFFKFFSFLENIIPENEKENFYRNLKTLNIKLNLNYDFLSIEETDGFAYYNILTNKVEILPTGLKKLFRIALKRNNPIEFFIEVFEFALLHELFHMASTNYDEENKIYFTGFSPNLLETKKRNDAKFGLTEGMTEALAWEGNPNMRKKGLGYYNEPLFVIQLMQIVGRNLMLESYFGNKGTIGIEKELDKFSNGNLKSDILLNNIETNFWLLQEQNKVEQKLLASIQSTLIEYYKNKMLYLVENKLITKEEVENSLAIYEEALITSELLKKRTGNIEIYIGLDESIEKFYLVKQEVISMLSSNYTKKRAL